MPEHQLDIVVINLKKSRERRERMKSVLEPLGLPFRFFEAIDGRTTPHPLFKRYDPKLAEIRYGFDLTPGELGCFASHYLNWQTCFEANKPILILEDDIAVSQGFVSSCFLAAEKVTEYGLLRLSAHKDRSVLVCETFESGQKIVRFLQSPLGGSAYALSPWAAERFVRQAEIWFEPVDCLIDRYWDHGVGSFGIFPLSVTHTAPGPENSDIWQGVGRGPRSKRSRRFPLRRRFFRLRDNVLRGLYKKRHGL
ncbi:glycosyltransferase family 25 protein [Roseibium sp. M-1]